MRAAHFQHSLHLNLSIQHATNHGKRPYKSMSKAHQQRHLVCNAADNSSWLDNSAINLPSPAPSPPAATKNKAASGTSVKGVSPWELMGRVVKQETVFDSEHVQGGLIRSAAASAVGLELEDFEERLQRLLALMPFLNPRLTRMNPKLLGALTINAETIASRLIELKFTLPEANIESVCSQRPSILLDEEWSRIPASLAGLRKHYSDEVIGYMVAVEPLLLLEDIEAVLKELARLVKGDVVSALGRDPSLATQVSNLAHLSLWLSGVPLTPGATGMLQRDPSIILGLQRGTTALGPGAEF